jgi:hypothetical protein
MRAIFSYPIGKPLCLQTLGEHPREWSVEDMAAVLLRDKDHQMRGNTGRPLK